MLIIFRLEEDCIFASIFSETEHRRLMANKRYSPFL